MIVGYQREELAIPEIGEVDKLNTPDGQTSQFVRVTSVDHSVESWVRSFIVRISLLITKTSTVVLNSE